MKIGIALPHYDFSYPDGRPADLEATIHWAQRVEELGFDSVWVSDHFFLDLGKYGGPSRRFGSLEALTTLAAIAAETDRVRLGTLVLCYAFRHPPLVAKMAATLDVVSGGRLELGMGAGWYEDEFREYGFEFPSAGERMSRLAEALDIIGGMLARDTFTYTGRYYQVVEAPNEPQPVQRPRPPLIVGSKGGPRSLRIVADSADGWNTVWRWTPESYAARVADLERICEEVGREPGTVSRSVGLYTLVGDDLERRYRALQAWAPGGALDGTTLEQYSEGALVGSPEECVGRIKEFEALGVGHMILALASLPFAIHDPEQLDLIAERVLPAVRDGSG
jgi:F420-dependent oxidoreductase-like protein